MPQSHRTGKWLVDLLATTGHLEKKCTPQLGVKWLLGETDCKEGATAKNLLAIDLVTSRVQW